MQVTAVELPLELGGRCAAFKPRTCVKKQGTCETSNMQMERPQEACIAVEALGQTC